MGQTEHSVPSQSGSGVERKLDVCDVIAIASIACDTHQCNVLEQAERECAQSMAIPVELNGITMGPALVDQGASRSVMRLSAYKRFIKEHGSGGPRMVKKKNMFVIGSTGEKLPIVGCFAAHITFGSQPGLLHLRGTSVARTLFYVVQDTSTQDIICDMVIGRATIANSPYSCVDTQGTGALVCRDGQGCMALPCSPCTFETDAQGKRQLRMKAKDGTVGDSLTEEPDMDAIAAIHTLVKNRDGLTADEKAYLHVHLVASMVTIPPHEAIDGVMLGGTEEEDEALQENTLACPDTGELDAHEQVYLCHLMSELGKLDTHSEEEKDSLTSLMTSFVPEVVRKPAHKTTHSGEQSEELDEIEFPFTPPTYKDDTSEYLAEKRAKIAEHVRANEHLDHRQQDQLIEVLYKFADRFSMRGENMERTDSVHHEIDTKERRPFRERLRQYSPAIQDIINKEVEKMLKEGVIVQSKSPYASNLLLVRKPDASSEGGVKNRVCASFVRLNNDTEKDSYPLPNIQYIFDRIGRSVWFTTMDLLSGFWQVMIKPEHRHKTAFITMRGLYEFVVMPFGLCNAPATFQRLMDHVIKPEYRAFIETYIDDLMTHSRTFEEHLRHLEVLLTSLREHKLVVKLSKCKFAQKEVKFLGHVIAHNEIKTNPEAVEAINRWQRPMGNDKKAVTAVRGFLGMAGWYRKFIPHFADIAKPLVHLTKNDVAWEWTPACQKAFEQLRDALTTSPVLAVADPNKSYVLHTDASDHAMGAILQQEDADGNRHPVAYASKTFTDTQKRYSVTEREALAIVWALEHFNTYCEGHKYTLLTDHKALSYIRTNTNNNKRITRWQLLLQNYQVDIYYMKGKDNHAADLLSRPMMEETSVIHTMTTMDDEVVVVNAMAKKRKQQKAVHYEVEEIVGKRVSPIDSRTHEYRVRWKGYTEADDTWVKTKDLAASDMVADYERKQVTVATDAEPSQDMEVPGRVCGACEEVCANEAAWHIHRYHEHHIVVPSDMLTRMDATTDVTVFAHLQRQDAQFRCVFNTDLGERLDVALDKYERRTLMNHEFVISDSGLLYMMDTEATRSRMRSHTQLRLCIPKTERGRLLREYHHTLAHPGIMHMYDTMREKVWWPSMKKDIYKYVSECHECQVNKSEKVKTLTRPMSIPARPWSHVAIDHVGPFPMSNNGNKYILVIVDRFTRYAEAVAVTDTSAVTSAEAIVKYIICRYGMFEVLLSDRGSGFMSELFRHVMALLGVKQTKTTAYHPRSNGGVERFNKTLKKMIKLWVNKQHSDWDVLLPFALFAYNTSVHTSLKETPFYLNFARQARTITDIMTDVDVMQRKTVHAYAHEVTDKLRTVHAQVRDILRSINSRRQEALEAEETDPMHVTAGDSVYLYDETTPKKRASKFIKRWRGPYTVVKVHDNGTVTILKPRGESLVSRDRLRKKAEDCQSIEELHRQDVDLAVQELAAINDSMVAMRSRQQELQVVVDVAQGVTREVDSGVHDGMPPDDGIIDSEGTIDSSNNIDAETADDESIDLDGLIVEPEVVVMFMMSRWSSSIPLSRAVDGSISC